MATINGIRTYSFRLEKNVMVTRKVNNKIYYLPSACERLFYRTRKISYNNEAWYIYTRDRGIGRLIYVWKSKMTVQQMHRLVERKLAFNSKNELIAHQLGDL